MICMGCMSIRVLVAWSRESMLAPCINMHWCTVMYCIYVHTYRLWVQHRGLHTYHVSLKKHLKRWKFIHSRCNSLHGLIGIAWNALQVYYWEGCIVTRDVARHSSQRTHCSSIEGSCVDCLWEMMETVGYWMPCAWDTTYIHLANIHTHVRAHLHTYVCTDIRIHSMHTHTCVRTHTHHTHTHTCLHAHTYMRVRVCLHMCAHTHTHTHAHRDTLEGEYRTTAIAPGWCWRHTLWHSHQ